MVGSWNTFMIANSKFTQDLNSFEATWMVYGLKYFPNSHLIDFKQASSTLAEFESDPDYAM